MEFLKLPHPVPGKILANAIPVAVDASDACGAALSHVGWRIRVWHMGYLLGYDCSPWPAGRCELRRPSPRDLLKWLIRADGEQGGRRTWAVVERTRWRR